MLEGRLKFITNQHKSKNLHCSTAKHNSNFEEGARIQSILQEIIKPVSYNEITKTLDTCCEQVDIRGKD
jgi:hypothetical protein